jgi:hypothetical protein
LATWPGVSPDEQVGMPAARSLIHSDRTLHHIVHEFDVT